MTDTTEKRSTQTILALVREVEAEAPGGAEALFMAAMLAETPLPYDFALSCEGTMQNPSLLNPAAAFFAATATIDPLVTRDLIKVDVDSQIFALQDDVREGLSTSMNDEDKAQWAGRAIYALNLILPDAEPENWPMVEWLMPHILACRNLVNSLDIHTPAANRVLHQAGFSLYHQNRHHEAAELLDLALAVDVAVKGRNHPDICTDLEGLGTVLWAAQDYPRAEGAFTACLDLQREILTEKNLATAPVLNSLAVVRQALGRYEDADNTFKECLRVLQAGHGEGHPAIASCLSNIALLYEAMGKPEEALRLAERSLEINRAFFGDVHQDVASDCNTIALLHDALGHGDQSEKYFRESLTLREQLFGADHPETAQALCNLALLLDTMDRADEAVQLYEKGLSSYEAALGPNHPLMESALDNYIVLLEKTGKRPESDALRTMTQERLRRIVERAK